MLRRLYDWTMDLATKPYAVWALFFVSFAEASFFPIPPDLLLIPLVVAMPKRAFYLAAVCTIGSVMGAVLGYIIGAFLFDQIGAPILEFYHMQERYGEFAQRFNEFGPWVVLFAGVTPFPFKVITILSGATELNFFVFVISSIVARALRFFLVAGILYYVGPPAREFIEKRFGLVVTIFMIMLIGGFYLVRYL